MYTNLNEFNRMAGRPRGADYFKIDVEGYEWSILRSIMKWAAASHDSARVAKLIPQQIYAEFHFDRDVVPPNKQVANVGPDNGAYIGYRLRAFFQELFVKAGYMVMFTRTAMYARNRDALLVKLFCPKPPSP